MILDREKLLVNVTTRGKSYVNLLIDKRFFVKRGTTSTSNNSRDGVGEMVPMWVMGREAPFPKTTQSLPV